MEPLRAEREHFEAATVVLDVDRLETVGEDWALASGDDAVEQLAAAIGARLRVCPGGAEFAVALVRVEESVAERVMAELNRSLGAVRVGTPADGVRFAYGMSGRRGHTGECLEGAGLTDHALYWRKSGAGDEWLIQIAEPVAAGVPGTARTVRKRALIETLEAVARALDAKNRFMRGHSERVATYAVALAQSLGLDAEATETIRLAALLHDVGKIAVPEGVLVKESPPNLDDGSRLARHSPAGRAMLTAAGLPDAGRWILHLHERFDGRGFPDRLAGRQIPVESRILHAADALDQMTRPHAYRRHRPLREALAELAFGAGTRLDPELAQRLIQLVQTGAVAVTGQDAMLRSRRHPAAHRTRGGMVG